MSTRVYPLAIHDAVDDASEPIVGSDDGDDVVEPDLDLALQRDLVVVERHDRLGRGHEAGGQRQP